MALSLILGITAPSNPITGPSNQITGPSNLITGPSNPITGLLNGIFFLILADWVFGFLCSSDDSSLLVRIKWDDQGFLCHLNYKMSYVSLCEEIRRRFKFHHNDSIHLKYSLPGCDTCFLDSEGDFQMIFSGAKVYNLKYVEIFVSNESVNPSITTIGSGHGNCSVDEDDFLGLPIGLNLRSLFYLTSGVIILNVLVRSFSVV